MLLAIKEFRNAFHVSEDDRDREGCIFWIVPTNCLTGNSLECVIFMNNQITKESVGSVNIAVQQFNHPTGKYINNWTIRDHNSGCWYWDVTIKILKFNANNLGGNNWVVIMLGDTNISPCTLNSNKAYLESEVDPYLLLTLCKSKYADCAFMIRELPEIFVWLTNSILE